MQTYKVSELTALIQRLLSDNIPSPIMVNGEVTEFSKASSGHCYFSIKDESGKLKCVYFKQYIRPESFMPKNGDKVSVIGDLRIYAPDGSYQLMVKKVIYSAEGDFWKKFEETKQRLSVKGYFNESAKKAIPKYPAKVAVLTALTGAAVKDFIVTAGLAGKFIAIDVWGIPVQGAEAASKIAAVLTKVGKMTERYDALILTRGGGSLEDLAVFNEEAVAVALFNSKLPTLSAIGHEQDITIADLVADERASTPTAAAMRLTKYYKEAKNNVTFLSSRLSTLLRWRWENVNLRTDKIEARLNAHSPATRIKSYYSKHNAMQKQLILELKMYSANRERKLDAITGRLIAIKPYVLLQNLQTRYNIMDSKLNASIEMCLWKRAQLLGSLSKQLLATNPISTIGRLALEVDIQKGDLMAETKKLLMEKGHRLELLNQRLTYANPDRMLSANLAMVVNKDGAPITGVNSVRLEDELKLKMKDGVLTAFVTGKKIYDKNRD